eukprot:5748510-Prorocentrum_lima.AAC.1
MSCSCARGLPALGPAFLRRASLLVCPGTAPSDAPTASCPAGRGKIQDVDPNAQAIAHMYEFRARSSR